MLKGLSRGSKILLAAGVAGAAFGIATVVQAAIPGTNGVVASCYQFAQGATPKGTLRVIDKQAGEGCRYYEHPLNWNGNGVAGVYAISGQVDTLIPSGYPIPANDPEWLFEGPTATITITATQSFLANVTASLGVQCFIGLHPNQPCPSAKPNIEPAFNEFGFGVCFQNAVGGGEGGNPVVNMNQFTGGNNSNYAAASYENGEQDYTGIGTAAPGAGTYNVGYCVQNYGEENLNDNNWANGYVEVVDGVPNTSGVSQVNTRGGD